MQAVRALQQDRVRWLDVRRDVAAAFDVWVQERVRHTVFAGGCRSWYLTENGRNTQNWPASTLTFRRRLRRFRGAADWVKGISSAAAKRELYSSR